DVDLDQLDDPVLSTNICRLNGLEEEVLWGMLMVGGRDRQRRLKHASLGEAEPYPRPGFPSLRASRAQPALEHAANDFFLIAVVGLLDLVANLPSASRGRRGDTNRDLPLIDHKANRRPQLKRVPSLHCRGLPIE